jgi:hypothetical protein
MSKPVPLPNYEVLEASSPQALQTLVNLKITAGYTVAGGVSVVVHNYRGYVSKTVYYQAVIRKGLI